MGKDTSLCFLGQPAVLKNLADNIEDTYFFKWSTGAATEQIIITHPGAYGLSQTNSHGCISAEKIIVNKDCNIDIPNVFTPNSDGTND